MSFSFLSHGLPIANARSMLVKLYLGLFAIVLLMRLVDSLAN
jgi:hypothetical protein